MPLGLNADPAERPTNFGDRHHGQGNGKEIWQILQEDDLFVSTERPREKVRLVSEKTDFSLSKELTMLYYDFVRFSVRQCFYFPLFADFNN